MSALAVYIYLIPKCVECRLNSEDMNRKKKTLKTEKKMFYLQCTQLHQHSYFSWSKGHWDKTMGNTGPARSPWDCHFTA